MLGEINKGWTVGKRLLQHERASQTGARPSAASARLAAGRASGSAGETGSHWRLTHIACTGNQRAAQTFAHAVP